MSFVLYSASLDILDWTWENFTEVLDRAERDGKPLGGVLRMPSFSIDYEKNLNGWMDALGNTVYIYAYFSSMFIWSLYRNKSTTSR